MAELTRQINDRGQIKQAIAWAEDKLNQGLAAGPAVIKLCRPSRTAVANAKFHVMLEDMRQQGWRATGKEPFKALMVNQFAREMERLGEPLANPGERVWDWENEEVITVRPSTTQFSRHEAAKFVEYLYAKGVEYGIEWHEPAMSVYNDYREAR